MELTPEELAIIESRLPFHSDEPGIDRLKAISDFMLRASLLHFYGAEWLVGSITAVDDAGTEVQVVWENGDSSVGISSGWVIFGTVKVE